MLTFAVGSNRLTPSNAKYFYSHNALQGMTLEVKR